MLPEFSFPTVTYGIAFLLNSIAMNNSTPCHEDALLLASAQLDVRIGSPKVTPARLTQRQIFRATKRSSRRLIPRYRSTPSSNRFVSSASGLIATVHRNRINRERATHNRPKENSP